MNDILKPLLESDLLSEDVKVQISEAFEAKIAEVRDEVETQLREEMANRFEHDREALINAVSQMVEEALQVELEEFQADRQAVVEDRVRLANQITENAQQSKDEMVKRLEVMESFILNVLKEEIVEFESDRKSLKEAKAEYETSLAEQTQASEAKLANTIEALTQFVTENLHTELKEFKKERQGLVEQREKLVKEGKIKLEEARRDLINRTATIVEEQTNAWMKDEMVQLHEDIVESRKNAFGKKIFEQFEAEFASLFFSKNSVVRDLRAQLEEAKAEAANASTLLESAQVEAKEAKKRQMIAESTAKRSATLNELLGKLNGKARENMAHLLEGVATENLNSAFSKYLPSITSTVSKQPTRLVESKKVEVSGNRKPQIIQESVETDQEDVDLGEIKRLAGI
ncbi:MAG: hypothetical protein M0R77_21135 [Gammaproteobacteria bacterium]|nr:hypothetical protein [Gammaproteobacteria bacterium]